MVHIESAGIREILFSLTVLSLSLLLRILIEDLFPLKLIFGYVLCDFWKSAATRGIELLKWGIAPNRLPLKHVVRAYLRG